MSFYKYAGRDRHGDYVAGIVKANDIVEATYLLNKAYDDYNSWKDVTLEKVTFDHDAVCEVYYG